MLVMSVPPEELRQHLDRGYLVPIHYGAATAIEVRGIFNFANPGKQLFAHLARGFDNKLPDDLVWCENHKDIAEARRIMEEAPTPYSRFLLCTGLIDKLKGIDKFVSEKEVLGFVLSLFQRLNPDCKIEAASRASELFPADRNYIVKSIGEPIERKYGLAEVGFAYGLPNHDYLFNDSAVEWRFGEKYPEEVVYCEKFTLADFASLVYDLLRIKQDLPIFLKSA